MNAIHIRIPSPCSESWGGMTPVSDITSYCKSCDKVLVDFSSMSDTEIALWFRQNKGKVCGRFSENQLGRNLQVPAEKPVRANRKIWLNVMWLLPAAWMAKPATAQEVIKSKPPVSVNTGEKQQTISQEITKIGAISGKVTDGESKKGLSDATIYIRRGEKIIATVKAAKNGEFNWKVPAGFDTTGVTVEARAAFYEPLKRQLTGNGKMDFVLYPEMHILGDVYIEPEN